MRQALVRALVLDLYARISQSDELADKALHRTLRAHPELHSRERRHVAEATYAMVRLGRRIDYQLRAALGKRFDAIPTPDLDRARYAAAAATELALPISEALAFSGAHREIEQALGAIVRCETVWPDDRTVRLALEHSMPDWFAERLIAEYGEAAPKLAASLNARAPLTLRMNALLTDREKLLVDLAAEKVNATAGALSPWSVLLDGHANVFGLKAYKAGHFEIQDEGSQLIALAAAAKPGDHVLDACAGGGGKTLALAASMKNKGRIVACDVSESRLRDLPERARLARVFVVDRVVVPPGDDSPLASLTNRMDSVLVDAPCSGTGAWRRHADARWKLTEAQANEFPARQLEILERFSRCVKVGGRLVYATCSILSAENEGVVAAFLEKNPGFQVAKLSDLPAPAIDSRGHLRVVPHVHGTDGFYAAALRRVS